MSTDPLDLANRLLAAGVPVVVVPWGGTPPSDWQHLTADRCDLSSYRPGCDALALVGGHGVDLVDEDTKDGGSVDNLPPFKNYGVTRTPTGGRHFVVPSNGVGKMQLTTEDGHVGDYVGGRADGTGRLLGYLPGSVRSKPEHGGRAYVEEEPWAVEDCVASLPDDDLTRVLTACGGSGKARDRHLDDSPEREPALGVHPYAEAAIQEELQRLRDLPSPWHPGAYWDNTTFEVACVLQEFANSGWTGYSPEQALQDLLDNAPADERWGEREHRAKWASALNTVDGGGRRNPDVTAEDEFEVVGTAEVTEPPRGRFTFRDGGAFILDTSPDAVPIWGRGSEVLMAEGEALILAAPQGLGKTTLAQQFALGRCGLLPDLLGYPIEPGKKRVLYLAMDRPKQAARSFRRMVREADRAALNDLLVVWEGPPQEDMAANTDLLAEMCAAANADTVIVDSLKDAALSLSEDGPGAAWNRSRQTALQAGVQVLELHHNRKKQQGVRSAPTIDEIYGSTWITSGAGSVVLLSGHPGDLIVNLHHVKQPADPVGPFQIVHDHDRGATTVYHSADLLALAAATKGGITARDAAAALFDTESPTANDKKKAERRLAKLVSLGQLVVVQEGSAASKTPTKWALADDGGAEFADGTLL